jgi:hypothetical protein
LDDACVSWFQLGAGEAVLRGQADGRKYCVLGDADARVRRDQLLLRLGALFRPLQQEVSRQAGRTRRQVQIDEPCGRRSIAPGGAATHAAR